MDVFSRSYDIRFEWDSEKDKINQRKHGVAFSVAKKVFADENRLDFPDEAHSQEEERRITIGKARKILFVVYTERDNDRIRLISARRADEEEEVLYYDRD